MDFSRLDFLFKKIEIKQFNINFITLLIKLKKTDKVNEFFYKNTEIERNEIIKELKHIKYRSDFYLYESINDELINEIINSPELYVKSSKNKKSWILLTLALSLFFGVLSLYIPSPILKSIFVVSIFFLLILFIYEYCQKKILNSWKVFKLMKYVNQNIEEAGEEGTSIYNDWQSLNKKSEHKATKELSAEATYKHLKKENDTDLTIKNIELLILSSEKINKNYNKIPLDKLNKEVSKNTKFAIQYLNDLLNSNDDKTLIKTDGKEKTYGAPYSLWQINKLIKELFKIEKIRNLRTEEDRKQIASLYYELFIKVIDLLKEKDDYKALYDLANQSYRVDSLNVVIWINKVLKDANLEIGDLLDKLRITEQEKAINSLPLLLNKLNEFSKNFKNERMKEEIENILSRIQIRISFDMYNKLLDYEVNIMENNIIKEGFMKKIKKDVNHLNIKVLYPTFEKYINHPIIKKEMETVFISKNLNEIYNPKINNKE